MLINSRINIHFCANELGGETFNWHCRNNEVQNIHFMIMNIKNIERLFHGELERTCLHEKTSDNTTCMYLKQRVTDI